MTNTITTSALDLDWSVCWWLLVPVAIGLLFFIMGIHQGEEDGVYAGIVVGVFVTLFLFIIIAPSQDYDKLVADISDQLNYSEVDYESNMQFTAKDEEGYYIKCAVLGTDKGTTYEVVCAK